MAHQRGGVPFAQPVIPGVGQNRELLVGGGVVQHPAALVLKGLADGQRFFIRRRGKPGVQPVLQKRQKLQPQQPALGQHAAVLLDGIAEILFQLLVGDDQRLPEQRTALGSAQIEYIAQRGVVLQAQVVGGAGKAVGHAGAVHKQRQAQLIAGGGNVG